MKLKTSALLLFLLCSVINTWAQKYGFVDTKIILESLPEYQSAQKQLDRLSQGWEKEINGLKAEKDKLQKDLQAEAILLTEDLKKSREKAITEKEKEIRELQSKYFGTGGSLLKKRQELVKPIQESIFNAIKTISERKSYAAVFDVNSDLTILYVNVKYDISDEVLKELGSGTKSNSNKK